jgi:GT2 family glycosyltransferase
MKSLKISVGLVTWNSAKYLEACLDSLLKQVIPIELIVVDNNSNDASISIVKNQFPDARIIHNTENLGFCGGHNQAIRASCGEYYLALNPDIQLESNFLNALVNQLDLNPDYGMASGKLYLINENTKTNILDTSGLFIDRKRQQHLYGHNQVDQGKFNKITEVFGVDGSAPLYRREMLEDIKIDGEYFDEAFFAHKEDVDIVWRARLLGWRCLFVPDAVGYHCRSFRPGKRKYLTDDIRLNAVKNRYLLILKNETVIGFRRDWPFILWYDLKILFYLILFERSSLQSFKIIHGIWDRIIHWRKEIMRKKRVSDKEISTWFMSAGKM